MRSQAREADIDGLGWRYYSDGVGELHPFCPLCIRREFAPDAPASVPAQIAREAHPASS